MLTELPAVFVLYDSSFWSGVFLLVIFAVSVWNGGGFYIEVFGRKYVLRSPVTYPATIVLTYPLSCLVSPTRVLCFSPCRRFERELEALRKELAEALSRSERSSPTLGPQSDDDLTAVSPSSSLNSKTVSPNVSAVELPLETLPSVPVAASEGTDTETETRKDR